MEGDVMSMHDLFVYTQTGVDKDRVAQGFFTTTGIRAQCLGRLEASGNALPVAMFERRVLNS